MPGWLIWKKPGGRLRGVRFRLHWSRKSNGMYAYEAGNSCGGANVSKGQSPNSTRLARLRPMAYGWVWPHQLIMTHTSMRPQSCYVRFWFNCERNLPRLFPTPRRSLRTICPVSGLVSPSSRAMLPSVNSAVYTCLMAPLRPMPTRLQQTASRQRRWGSLFHQPNLSLTNSLRKSPLHVVKNWAYSRPECESTW